MIAEYYVGSSKFKDKKRMKSEDTRARVWYCVHSDTIFLTFNVTKPTSWLNCDVFIGTL